MERLSTVDLRCTKDFKSALFYIENIIYIFYKTSYLDEEVNRTEPSPSVSIPWLSDFWPKLPNQQKENTGKFDCTSLYPCRFKFGAASRQ